MHNKSQSVNLDWLKIILSYIILPLFYFHVNTLGQVGEGAVGVARPYGLAERVEYSVSGFAFPGFFDVRNDNADRAAGGHACRTEWQDQKLLSSIKILYH